MTFLVRIGTFKFVRLARVIVFGACGFVLAITIARAQSPNATSDLTARINRERIARGLIPYALSAQLSSAAQAHANDIARTGRYSHIGSDGSSVFDRVARVGYGAYSWGRRLGENWAWYHDAATAMQMWMGSAPHRANILHTVYREFGIGIAPAANGGFIYVIDFGAQPNVLPVFIQNGASDAPSSKVTIALSNEDYAMSGDGAKTIGKATQVQISSSPDFAGTQWQPFVSKFAWTLPSGDGTKAVYVKYRDARGRTVTSSDTIVSGVSPAFVSTRIPSPTPKPTSKPSPTITKTKPTTTTATATGIATSAPSPTITLPLEATVLPSPTLAPEPTTTDTPLPTDTPTPEVTETPISVSIAMVAEETPVGMLDSQEEIQSTPLPPTSEPAYSQASIRDQVTPIALSIFGMSVMLGILAVVKWLAHRTPHD